MPLKVTVWLPTAMTTGILVDVAAAQMLSLGTILLLNHRQSPAGMLFLLKDWGTASVAGDVPPGHTAVPHRRVGRNLRSDYCSLRPTCKQHHDGGLMHAQSAHVEHDPGRTLASMLVQMTASNVCEKADLGSDKAHWLTSEPEEPRGATVRTCNSRVNQPSRRS